MHSMLLFENIELIKVEIKKELWEEGKGREEGDRENKESFILAFNPVHIPFNIPTV